MITSFPIANNVEGFLRLLELEADDSAKIRLFRGQAVNYPLIPKVGRQDPAKCNIDVEKELLFEFRRRLAETESLSTMDDWELLTYAQHYGLATRLLDWSSNPLVAIWFACRHLKVRGYEMAYVYILECTEEAIEKAIARTPFELENTIIIKPKINNPRIAAQNGWFTAHAVYPDGKGYICLTDDTHTGFRIYAVGISGASIEKVLAQLDLFGVNDDSVYLGAEGVANYLNWKHRNEL